MLMSTTIVLQKASPKDASLLSNLAMRSKAYWGYSDEFMRACREELTITPDMLQNEAIHTVCAHKDREIVGFYSVEHLSSSTFELDALFVDPAHIGSGVGRVLMTHAKTYIATQGGMTLIIQSDPNAEGFYRAMGGQLIGKRESDSIAGRFLSVLSIEVQRADALAGCEASL